MKRSERKEDIAKRRKSQILNASLMIFSKRGFDKATASEIANKAGVSVGTIYNYYCSKHDLFISLIENCIFSEPILGVKKRYFQYEHDDISGIINGCLGTGIHNIDLMLLLLSEAQRDHELRRQYVGHVIRPALILLEKHLSSLDAVVSSRFGKTHVLSHVLLSMMMGLAILYRIEGKKGLLRNISRHELVAEITGILLGGINNPPVRCSSANRVGKS